MTAQECVHFIAGGAKIIGHFDMVFSDGFAEEHIPVPIRGPHEDGWIQRMTRRFGGTVYDREGGPYYGWDWGQALCRARYGLDWNDLSPIDPDEEAIRIAQEWEDGEWPPWAYTNSYDPQEVAA